MAKTDTNRNRSAQGRLESNIGGARSRTLYRGKSRGQALPIIALSMMVLIAIVGLAIDGGSMYGERRRAQNASDGAALAGAQKMLRLYQQMVLDYRYDVDGSESDENHLREVIDDYAEQNGITVNSTNLHAYYVNDQKQLVTASFGENGCSQMVPCEVGRNRGIPWTRGAKGIVVTSRAVTNAYFMSVFGFSNVSAVASATAYMGIAVDSRVEVGLLPVGFFTDTDSLDRLVVGNTYTLINGSTRQGSGNWGWVDFNGQGNPAPVVDAWIGCGYNPAVTTRAQWLQWCTDSSFQSEDRAVGPTQYWTGPNEPLTGPIYEEALKWPTGDNGWWIAGSSGTTNSTCQTFEDLAPKITNHDYLVPVFDRSNGQGGNGTKFHLINLAWFHITTVDIQCHPRRGEEQHWSVEGTFIQHYSSGGTGRHGDVRHTSNPIVFLEP
ncbi:MAG TPA: Tad domain-containing protein [Chloroflexia bacterium]|nr:Tad domain-containing protein [Chloroflexia bacterium]